MPSLPLDEAVACSSHWIVALLSAGILIIVIVIHYEALERLNSALPHLHAKPRLRIPVLIVALFSVHTLEIWIYGGALYGISQWPQFGGVAGIDQLKLLDAVYLSTTTYTTLGYGDLVPTGPIRLLLGIEALSGFLLVTWSASFTYLEMQRNWQVR